MHQYFIVSARCTRLPGCPSTTCTCPHPRGHRWLQCYHSVAMETLSRVLRDPCEHLSSVPPILSVIVRTPTGRTGGFYFPDFSEHCASAGSLALARRLAVQQKPHFYSNLLSSDNREVAHHLPVLLAPLIAPRTNCLFVFGVRFPTATPFSSWFARVPQRS